MTKMDNCEAKNEIQIETKNYVASAESFKVYIPAKQKEVTKNGKTKSFPIYVRRIVLNCKRSGNEIKFPATTRKGILSFGDSRPTANLIKSRYTIAQMIVELSNLVGNEIAKQLVNVALG